MNLRMLTDDELHLSTIKTSDKQREVTLELLNHLNEVDRRRLYSKFNCSSLHGYCVQELKMTSGNACHHIDAARLLRQLPQLEEKLISGAIAMTTIASAESFFKREARNGNKFDSEMKQEVLAQLESISTREAEKVLISHSSKPEIHLKEKLTQKTESIVELKVNLDEETMAMLERLKEVWSHAMPHASFADLIKRAAKEAVEKNDPLKKIERSEARAQKAKDRTVEGTKAKAKKAAKVSKHPNQAKTPAPGFEVEATEIAEITTATVSTKSAPCSSAEIRRQIWSRDKGCCTFEDPRTGERCDAKHFIEEDHIVPKAMGGKYAPDNIRLRCRAHNQRHSINCYGEKKMDAYLYQRIRPTCEAVS